MYPWPRRKQYLKLDEKWKDWDNVDMKWISHHNPDFVVLDDQGNEKERYDLQGWSARKLEKFMEVGARRSNSTARHSRALQPSSPSLTQLAAPGMSIGTGQGVQTEVILS